MLVKLNYFIYNNKTKESYQKQFDDLSEARHWIINHLDLSLDWIVQLN